MTVLNDSLLLKYEHFCVMICCPLLFVLANNSFYYDKFIYKYHFLTQHSWIRNPRRGNWRARHGRPHVPKDKLLLFQT